MMVDYLLHRCYHLAGSESQFELNALWAIENRVSLDQLEVSCALAEVFSYHLLRDDPDCFQSFLEFCGAPNDGDTLRHLWWPSRVSRPDGTPTSQQPAVAFQVADAVDLSAHLAPTRASVLG